MLTATDLRTSKTAKIKTVILLYHCSDCTSSYVNVQQYSKITFFLFLRGYPYSLLLLRNRWRSCRIWRPRWVWYSMFWQQVLELHAWI